jgi:omega-6 fatty acid desaturase (delta-12 desaturase)
VWAPASVEEFKSMPVWRQNLERLYRSGWGPIFYYLIEIWWNKMYFPSKKNMPSTRKIFFRDSCLVTVFGLIWISALIYAGLVTEQSLASILICGFVIPYLFWEWHDWLGCICSSYPHKCFLVR